MLSYSGDQLAQLADRLDRGARIVPLIVAGVLAGAGAGAGMFASVFLFPGTAPWISLVLALVLGAIGYLIANVVVVSLRLQGQQALCQRKLEENIRPR
jgi:hypothetical protein